MKKTIVWEKWRDPFGFDDDEPVQSQDIIDPDEYDTEEYSVTKKITRIKSNVISTPLGIIPFNESTDSSKIFNFWTGHTTFPVTLEIASLIEECEGVETLNIFTKYRFRLAVGKAFDDSKVLRHINYTVNRFLENNNDV
jgi:hypothetical protein